MSGSGGSWWFPELELCKNRPTGHIHCLRKEDVAVSGNCLILQGFMQERGVCSLNMFSNCGLGKDRYLAVLGSLLKATWDLASLRREIVVGYGEA